MKILDHLFLINVRKEPYFFWCRLVIGLIIALSIHYYGAVDPQQIIIEIEGKQVLLVVLTIILCIPMAVMHVLKPQNRHIHSFQRVIVETCKAALMTIRGALIMGIAVILYCMVAEQNLTLTLTFANFLLALEFASSTYSGFDSFKLVPVEKRRETKPD